MFTLKNNFFVRWKKKEKNFIIVTKIIKFQGAMTLSKINFRKTTLSIMTFNLIMLRIISFSKMTQ